jgi:hypothetical protein
MTTLFSFLLTRFLTEKFLGAIFIHIAEYLVTKTSNELDDKIVAEIKKAMQ